MLGVIALTVPRSILTVEVSAAALYRSIELYKPSFVIDEFDNVLANAAGDEGKGALRSVINSGHTRRQGVLRTNKDTHLPEPFSTFGPKAIGMIGRRLPAMTLSRSIVVELERRKTTDRFERFDHEDSKELSDLRGQLLRWSIDNLEALRVAKKTVAMPEGFDNRRGDNWRVLFAIADMAGEEIAEHARQAAVKIEGSIDSRSIRARLLSDIRSIFYPKDDDGRDLEPLPRISSNDLATQLGAMPDGPWAEWKNGKPITQVQLARLLDKISPKNIRLASGAVLMGFDRAQFEDAWERYLSPCP